MRSLSLIFIFISSLAWGQAYQDPSSVVLNPFADKTGLNYYPDSVELEADLSGDPAIYQESYVDYLLTFNAKLTSVRTILKGHQWGDYGYATVHLNNESKTQVLRIGNYFRFDDSKQDQGWVGPNYDSMIPMGLIIRMHYGTKKSSGDKPKVIWNFELHKLVP